MPLVRFMPDGKTVQVRPGTTLLQAGRQARVNIRTRCGAMAACLMCKVKVDDQSGLSEPNQNEVLKLGSQLEEGVRLSCQAAVRGDVTAIVPEDPLKAAIRAQLAKQREEEEW